MNSIRNRGVLNVQSTQLIGGASASGHVYTAVDTSASVPIVISGTIGTATDNIILEGFTVQLFPKD
jgi:hypothetical protein